MNSIKEKKELFNSLSEKDFDRIKDAQKFGLLKPGTYGYKLALENDFVRTKVKTSLLALERRLWNISNGKTAIDRRKAQIVSGVVTEELRDGVLYNIDELKVLVNQDEWILNGEVIAIRQNLGELRSLVGHCDVAGKIVMSEEDFEKHCENMEIALKSKGYDLWQ